MAGDGNFDTWDDFRFLQWRPPTRVARAEVVPAEETQKEKYDIDGLKDFIYHIGKSEELQPEVNLVCISGCQCRNPQPSCQCMMIINQN